MPASQGAAWYTVPQHHHSVSFAIGPLIENLYLDIVLFIDLKGRVTERGRHIEIFHTLVHSLNGHNSLGWVRLESRNNEFQPDELSYKWQKPKYSGHLCLLETVSGSEVEAGSPGIPRSSFVSLPQCFIPVPILLKAISVINQGQCGVYHC